MAWTPLASTVLSEAGDTIASGTFSAKQYLWLNVLTIPSGNANPKIKINGVTSSIYTQRRQEDGGSDVTKVNQQYIDYGRDATHLVYTSIQIYNIDDTDKIAIMNTVTNNDNGASNIPKSSEMVWKFADTSNDITEIDILNTQDGNFAVGSYLNIFGND